VSSFSIIFRTAPNVILARASRFALHLYCTPATENFRSLTMIAAILAHLNFSAFARACDSKEREREREADSKININDRG